MLFIRREVPESTVMYLVKLLGTVVRKIENKQVIALVSGLVVALVEDKTKDKKKLQLQREQFQTAIKKSVKELRVDDGKEAGGQMVEILTKVNDYRNT